MGTLLEQKPSSDQHVSALESVSSRPDVLSNLLLVRFLIDWATKQYLAKPQFAAILVHCKEILQEIVHAWNGLLDNESSVSARTLYDIHVVIRAIERLMACTPHESEDYFRLHKGIILLDEVDLMLEEFAAMKRQDGVMSAPYHPLPLAG